MLLFVVFVFSYGKGICQNANAIVNEANPLESVAVVCFFDAVPVQSIGPLPRSFVLIPEFALLSCYQDCADIMCKSPQSVSARRRRRSGRRSRRRRVIELMFQAISGAVSAPSHPSSKTLWCASHSNSKDGVPKTL